MTRLAALLQDGIVLTTPIFFVAALLILWRLVRTSEATLAVLVYVKHHLDIRQPLPPSEATHTSAQLRETEEKFYPTNQGEQADAGDRG